MVHARAESREDSIPRVRVGWEWLIGERVSDDRKVEALSEI